MKAFVLVALASAVLLSGCAGSGPLDPRLADTGAKCVPHKKCVVPDSHFHDAVPPLVAQVGLSAGQFALGALAGPPGMAANILVISPASCIEQQSWKLLKQAFAETRKEGRVWTMGSPTEDLEANTVKVREHVLPYCIPVLGKWRSAAEERDPLKAVLGFGSGILDFSQLFGVKLLPDVVASPLSKMLTVQQLQEWAQTARSQ